MIDERNSEVQVGTQVRLCLRDSHADGVPGVGSGAGEVGEEPPVDVVNLRRPHVVLAPHRPSSGREDVVLGRWEDMTALHMTQVIRCVQYSDKEDISVI